ncbi:MAG: alpha-glucosidase/alpha-galactosidase [Ruminococcaceae bacterium]|nr:alpha-glucosidase/alpha-galactosidase [Oscillospiraceae bacterium]
MIKIAFMGAGSWVFAKNVLGDCIITPELEDLHLYLYDINAKRLDESRQMMENIARNAGRKDVKIVATMDMHEALDKAGYVVNAIQVGGYDPCTITDFEVPKKYGLRQTIADTLGIGGIFRAMRTIPHMEAFARKMEEVCPDAIFMSYTNPCAMVSGYIQQYTSIQTVGLCHSAHNAANNLLAPLGIPDEDCIWEVAGINHQAWLLRVEDKDGNDLYPEAKKRSKEWLAGKTFEPTSRARAEYPDMDRVRHEIMHRFGYYVTESSEHNAEYNPWFIKPTHPELIDKYKIPLDEYIRRCINQNADWDKTVAELTDTELKHEYSAEYAAKIIKARETDVPYRFHGNVLNTGGLISNLPRKACVEVPCFVDRAGIHPTYVGDLPEQCAALNRTNINTQLLTIEGVHERSKDKIYLAAMMDPHTGAQLSIDEIVAMCDDLFEAHKDWLPEYK